MSEQTTSILIPCSCGKKLRLAGALAGKRVKCPSCGTLHTASGPAPAEQAVPAATSEWTPATQQGILLAEPPVPARQPLPLPSPHSTPVQDFDDEETPPPSGTGEGAGHPGHIGAYVIERVLGRGAHGAVYRAHTRKDPETPVALKIVASRGNLDTLLLEPALLAQLDHPCIVGVEDYFVAGTDLVVALEYIDGPDLATMLERGRTFSQAEVRDLVVQLAAALAQAHSRNIMHRDIKPANILVAREQGRDRFVLTDFGIGRRAEGIQVEKHAGGTYLYMAPEQLRGRPGPQSDLWALGVVAYRLLTGVVPFPGPSLQELSHQILYTTPPPPSQVCAQPVDPDLEAVVMRLLDKSLTERYSSAEEVLAALGFHGAPDTVLTRVRREHVAPTGAALERKLGRALVLRWVLLLGGILLYLASGGIVSGLVLLAGMIAFYFGQAGRKIIWTGAALGLMGVHVYIRHLEPSLDVAGLQVAQIYQLLQPVHAWAARWLGPGVALDVGLGVLGVALFVAFMLLPVFAGLMYVSIRRLQRQRMLRQLALAGSAGSEAFMKAFRRSLDSRFEDVEFHLKYAELLFSAGRIADAAVEARLLLVQDPYHFNGNLLLANAYYNLGLPADCLAVCEGYLATSGHCFEFGELRAQCRRRLAAL